MSKRKRIKGAKPSNHDAAYAELQEKLQQLSATVASANPDLLNAVTLAIQNAVQPYQGLFAQQEKDALVAEHGGWGSADIHRFPGVLT